MTELAYLNDIEAAYVRSFDAKVVATPPGAVVLDRTFFYPAGGGQECDLGSIATPAGASWGVGDVAKSGPHVVHRLRRTANVAASLRAGDPVRGELDWERRLRNMRLHTAQHLVSAVVYGTTGLRTSKATMRSGVATIDLEGNWPTRSPVDELVVHLAELIARPCPVRVKHVDRMEYDRAPAPRSGLVAIPESVREVRVIEIAPVDDCPCGGTHVRSTSEIGEILFSGEPAAVDGRARLTFTLGGPDSPTRPA